MAKLAAAGVVDGYPDGTYKGDRTMTRYEMAQIIARTLAKGAIGADDKLVSEFADELDNLGVRVAKPEKNADNVKITSLARMSCRDSNGAAVTGEHSRSRLRTDIFFTGEVNDNWHYVTMLRNEQFFQGQNENGEDDTDFQRAYLDGNIGVVKVTAGRYNENINDGNICDTRVDGIKATVPFGNAYFKAEYGKMAGSRDYTGLYGDAEENAHGYGASTADKFWLAEVGGTWGNFDLFANYLKDANVRGLALASSADPIHDDNIWAVGASYHVGKFGLGAMYVKGDDDVLKGAVDMDGHAADDYDDDGYVIKMNWGGARRNEPGSWGLLARYVDLGAPAVISMSENGESEYTRFIGEGFKGYKVGGNVTLAKNLIAEVDYYDYKGKETDKHARTLWSQLYVHF